VISETSTLQQTVDVILAESQLLQAIVIRAEHADLADLPSWLELVAEVEPLFGPMPGFATHVRRGISRETALVVRDPRDADLPESERDGGFPPASRPAAA